jgi:hypothetical protein
MGRRGFSEEQRCQWFFVTDVPAYFGTLWYVDIEIRSNAQVRHCFENWAGEGLSSQNNPTKKAQPPPVCVNARSSARWGLSTDNAALICSLNGPFSKVRQTRWNNKNAPDAAHSGPF